MPETVAGAEPEVWRALSLDGAGPLDPTGTSPADGAPAAAPARPDTFLDEWLAMRQRSPVLTTIGGGHGDDS